MTDTAQQTLAAIVTNDHRAATVFEKYQLDFCCKGKRTLADACEEKGLSAGAIAIELRSISETGPSLQMPFREMTAEQLIAHIVTRHHFHVKQAMPQLHGHLEKIAIKHGDSHHEMIEVLALFVEIRKEMTTHMQKEEEVVFPAITKGARAFANKEAIGIEAGIINEAINVLEAEHDKAGEIMMKIRELTNNYKEPTDACTTFKLALAELKAFEDDLHRHVHLENNILFPMAKQFIERGG